MIQNIYPSVLDNKYLCGKIPESDSLIFQFYEKCSLCCDNPENPFPEYSEFSKVNTFSYNFIYLFSLDGKKCYLMKDSIIEVPKDYSYVSIKSFRQRKVRPKYYLALATAYHLHCWYEENLRCSKCGKVLTPVEGERAIECTDCKRIIFPRINPAVIVGVMNGDKLLVTRYKAERGINYDALIAGFTEIGETLEQTVAREVKEETGLKVKNIRYYKSQPWGYTGCILAGFWCDVDGSTDITLDTNELSRAEWVDRADIVGQPDNLSLTNEMMMVFKINDKPLTNI